MEEKLEIRLFNDRRAILKLAEDAKDYISAIEDILSLISGMESSEEYFSKIKDIEKKHGVSLSGMCCTLKIADLDKNPEDIDRKDCLAVLGISRPIQTPGKII